MVSSKTTRFDFNPIIVSVLCLAGAGTGAYWLREDFNRTAGLGMGLPMGQIERREAKVRRKPSKSFAWSNAQQDERLFRRDSVQTGVGSAASIRFNDGTLLELGENSLVVIEDLQNLSLDFMKGSVVLHTAAGDRRVTVGKDGKTRYEELSVKLVTPEPLSRFFTPVKESKSIRFAWKPRAGQEGALPTGLVLQLSANRSFRGAHLRSLPVKDPHAFETELPLGEGNYFWRLTADGKPLTEAGQFRVIAASLMQPVAPGGSEMLRNYGEETATVFSWVVPEELGALSEVTHEIQVSRDAGFAALVARQEVAGTSGAATLRNLPEGVLYWRIRSHYGDLVVASRTERFAMIKEQKPEIALNLPENQKTLERLPNLHFSWKSDAQGLEYALDIQEVKAEAGPAIPTQRTHATSYLLKSPPPGRYRWRVGAYHGEKSVGETEWRVFSIFEGARIALVGPPDGSELYSWDKGANFDFEWKDDELLGRQPSYSYQIAVSRDADFKDSKLGPRQREHSMPVSKLELDSGQYFWKLFLVDANGEAVKSSEVRRLAFGLYPLLKAPVGVGPARQAVFNLVDKAENPAASWEAVKGAEGYEVTLYALDPTRALANASPEAVPAGSRVVSQTVTTGTSVEFKDLVPAHYVWSARAVDRIKRKGQAMPPRPFTVTFGEPLGAPKIISPEVQ